jgi:methionine aminopeptidase
MSDVQDRDLLEGVGAKYSLEAMLEVRARTRQTANEIASRMTPGLSEEAARKVAASVLNDAGLRKGWHKILVRFGINTIKNFEEPSEPGVVLGDDDIFFVDIGPIFEGLEGDAGTTVVVGEDPEMKAASTDVVTLWQRVREVWLKDALNGADLYRYADTTATEMGWRLNLELTGHRLSDFPHDAHYAGLLSDVGFRPTSGLWVLEIQIRHPDRPFGAFFEDMLIEDNEVQALSFA